MIRSGRPTRTRRGWPKRGLLAASLMLMGSACGGPGPSSSPPTITIGPTAATPSPSPSPTPECIPSGTELEIAAQAEGGAFPSPYAFDKDCLAAPADTRFTIRFDNRDADTHNIHILDHPAGTSLFTGKLVKGPRIVTYAVKPLPVGTYYFRCDIHPLRMSGTLLVGA